MFCTAAIPSFPVHKSRYTIISSPTLQGGVGGTVHQILQKTPSKKMLRRKQVRISPLVMVRPSLHVRDYSPEEVHQTWYTRKEIKDLKTEGKRIAGMEGYHHDDPQPGRIDQSSCASPSQQHSPSSTACTDRRDGSKVPLAPATISDSARSNFLRGLEGKTTLGLYRKRQVKFNAREAVLEEQQRQWQRGIRDEEAIAEAYFECAEAAHITAYMLGLRDEREARAIVESKPKSRGGGIGNSLLQITLQRWQSFEKHTRLL
jgi:hypothetical protein